MLIEVSVTIGIMADIAGAIVIMKYSYCSVGEHKRQPHGKQFLTLYVISVRSQT